MSRDWNGATGTEQSAKAGVIRPLVGARRFSISFSEGSQKGFYTHSAAVRARPAFPVKRSALFSSSLMLGTTQVKRGRISPTYRIC